MKFTYNINFVNKERSELLYNSVNTSQNNIIFLKSYYKSTNNNNEEGTKLSLTLKSPGDKKGGRDSSQYIRIKNASNGNSFVGNK